MGVVMSGLNKVLYYSLTYLMCL